MKTPPAKPKAAPIDKSPAELLATPVQFVKGVGPDRAKLLERMGLRTAADLLFHFPRDYQDFSDLRQIPELKEDVLQSILGEVEETEMRSTSTGKSILGVLIRQGDYYLRALWFNMPYMARKFSQGQQVLLSGKPRLNGGRWEMSHPVVQWIEADEGREAAARLLPVYSLTEGLKQPAMRHVIKQAVELYSDKLEEAFPPAYLQAHELLPIKDAIREIHFPANQASLQQARRRFVYQEMLILQLGLGLRRNVQIARGRSPVLSATAQIDARIIRLFPFELTAEQRKAIDEIAADMGRPTPMNRLLQGDVGCGKTVVAVYAMLLAVACGSQAALMAPTEVLARQHLRTLEKTLHGSRVRLALLSGGLTTSQRKDVLGKLAAGELDIVVGTQAIICSDAQFQKLGLVVIDEQHKFGVRQRATLKQSGADPHYLVMTATPIPRTVAMTLFGDLDVSTIAQLPPGRQSVHTYRAEGEQRAKWWDFFRKHLSAGRQGYVIVPLVEESDAVEAANIEAAFEELCHGELEAFRLGLVHGRMSGEEKDAALAEFAAGLTQVLVATSVVEVGIDVPNATLMTILSAERFGLAGLHQLRGRVSRGKFPGYCCVLADSPNEEAQRRLDAFVKSTDGFELAELDFELRGPGDLLGTRQHGLPPFYIADFNRDKELLAEAREDAKRLLADDPGLASGDHARLRRQVLVRYGKVLELGDVG